MRRVTILDDYQRVALSSADWSAVAERFELEVIDEHLGADALAERLAHSEVVVVMRERTAFPAELFPRLPELKLLVTTGMMNAVIDLGAAAAHGVTVSGARGGGNSVPELTLGMMIALTRHFAEEDASIRAGGWQHTIGPGLQGKTLGVLGLGRLGGPVADLARAFGMHVIAWDRSITRERAAQHGATLVHKRELFEESDLLTIHLPLTESSRGLVGARELAVMKPTAYLINTSRGPIVDESALLAALAERRIAGAALDVYETEPLPRDHPLRSAPNTLLLPHLGYVTTDQYAHFYADVVEDIVAWDDGSPVRLL
ncbi:D-2-hydroxyacid dehydrogenase family protein [Gryllotalpicola protaetiae]|uniref:D-2-hydroxyacid dehydrogenase family protein n=1 Tax=Gryllotalpicola protaetiae TaxID=2419771 RepID=A0A387BMD0_9MICO|nr:D-2-hydroxyacid dehydrogenase family protein [Gryllotalpicola protaetiae]AYG02186.1 D-2-hydroxyacid dehydrogenase family protein [Gryllotalpicola protaetiae]